MPHFYHSFVAPLAPQTAPLPISDRHVAPAPTQCLPGHYAQGDTFTAPSKVIPAIVAGVTLAMWTPTIPANAVAPAHVQGPSLVAPEKVLSLAAPSNLAGWTSVEGLPAKLFRFSFPEGFAAPPKLFPPAPITLDHWTPTIAQNAVTLPHAPGDIAAPPKLFPPATITLSNWFGTDGQAAVRYVFAQGDSWTAPAKFAIIAPAPITLANWLGELAVPAKRFTFAPGDIAAPPKLFPPATITLSNWFGTDGSTAVRYTFAVPEPFAAPPKFAIIAAAPVSLASWLPNDARVSFSSHLQPLTAAPEKVLATAISPTLSSWLEEVAAAARPQSHAVADIFTAPAKVPAPEIVTVDKWIPAIPPAIYRGTFSPGQFAAPDRVFLVGIGPTIEALSAQMRPGTEALAGRMTAAMEALSATLRASIEALGGKTVC